MLFNSGSFLIFFPIVLCVYFVVPHRLRAVVLLVASYFFYMSWNPIYIVLLLFCTCSTYFIGRLLDVSAKKKHVRISKWLLVFGVSVNLIILLYFKYYNFFIDNINKINSLLGINYSYKRIDIILPIGISFYVFQAISYIVDVYRNNTCVEKSILHYALYIAFFPQLVAGPIERSTAILGQIKELCFIKLFDYDRIVTGLKILLYGYFLKLVIADRIAIYVDTVFADYKKYNSTILVIAAVFFAIQIYCDFNSYSLIAMGTAKIMGINLMENFDTPYFSRSATEFWRRWHISLNTWFRDYVYIPLGGNKCSAFKHVLNILTVFFLSGLWHGASWNYVAWGAINGLYNIAEKYLKPIIQQFNRLIGTKTDSFGYKAAKTLYTFLLIDFAWIFFRAPSIGDAMGYINRIITRRDPWFWFGRGLALCVPEGFSSLEMRIALTGIIVIAIIDLLKYQYNTTLDVILERQCIWFRWGVYIAMIIVIAIFGVYGEGFQSMDFIYFQF